MECVPVEITGLNRKQQKFTTVDWSKKKKKKIIYWKGNGQLRWANAVQRCLENGQQYLPAAPKNWSDTCLKAACWGSGDPPNWLLAALPRHPPPPNIPTPAQPPQLPRKFKQCCCWHSPPECILHCPTFLGHLLLLQVQGRCNPLTVPGSQAGALG